MQFLIARTCRCMRSRDVLGPLIMFIMEEGYQAPVHMCVGDILYWKLCKRELAVEIMFFYCVFLNHCFVEVCLSGMLYTLSNSSYHCKYFLYMFKMFNTCPRVIYNEKLASVFIKLVLSLTVT